MNAFHCLNVKVFATFLLGLSKQGGLVETGPGYLKRQHLLRTFSFIFLCLYAVPGNCQVFGGNPSSIKWNQITTDTARVIFPAGLEDAGRRVSSIIHELQKNHTETIGNKLRKINIVLQNQSTVSNAYVGLGPYRSEFYLNAPSNSFELGSINWVDLLSLHEYRHVGQYSNFNIGLAKVASFLFGQEGQALANSASVPDWFFEGDAVFNETALTRQGRGRLPYFFKGYESLFKQDKRYSYMKLRNGSLTDYVPDHYQLGYLLVAYGREKYGADFWKKVSHDAAGFKPLIYPWQGAVKKYARVSYKKFVADAFAFYHNMWFLSKGKTVNYITPANNNYVSDYKYPYLSFEGSLIVLKRSYRRIPAFYRILQSGKEQKIGVRDIANDDYFSFNTGNIVYASYRADKRWGYREFSDIKALNIKTGKTQRITTNGRFFSPDISHDGQKVVAVEMRTNQISNLVALNLKGETLFRSKAARGTVYTYPKFCSNDSFVYTPVRKEDGKMALVKVELSTGKETSLIPFSERIFGLPTVQGDTIFFTSSYRSSDEIWAFVESSHKTFRVAVHPTGLYQGVYDAANKRLVASNFTADGYRLASIFQADLLWYPLENKEDALPDIYTVQALQQEKYTTLENITTRNFPVKKYGKAFNLFNFHSWRPEYSDPEFSLMLLGQNVLNTLQTGMYYTYNRNESSHKAGVNAIYGGWFIQPLVGASQTWNRSISLNRTSNVVSDSIANYSEFNVNAGLRLPLNFSSGKQYRNLTATATINSQSIRGTGIYKNFVRSQTSNYWQGRLQYSGQIQKAPQQIYPRWAQNLLLQYRSTVNRITANQFLANGSLFLPGFHINHNVVFTGAYQRRDTLGQYPFSNNFPFSRGYSGVDFPRMFRIGANYHFPLFYPDWGVGNMVYFKRLRANAFYDYTRIKSLRTGNKFSLNSVGGELFFDTKWWNQQDVSFGIRYSRLLDYNTLGLQQPNKWEIILPVGLF
ncbi:hypothetical protein [Segetibacter sp.]|uniref:TolB family protein n=1 Tax=Segetibacter sp. TaxID=2231182 RepID=UPI0026148D88|nr:hypothetical protein [Segetibacter sp.]MCW3079586.1 hypothetical protein [Segetibacter sp.]